MSEKKFPERPWPKHYYNDNGSYTDEALDIIASITGDPEYDLPIGAFSHPDGKGGYKHGIHNPCPEMPSRSDVERHPAFLSRIGHTSTNSAVVSEIVVDAPTTGVEEVSPPPSGLRLVPGVAPKNTDH